MVTGNVNQPSENHADGSFCILVSAKEYILSFGSHGIWSMNDLFFLKLPVVLFCWFELMKTQSHATSRVFVSFGNCWVDTDLAEIIPKAKILPIKCANDLQRRPCSLTSILLRILQWSRVGEVLCPVEVGCVSGIQGSARGGCCGSTEPRPFGAPVSSAEHQRAQTL